MILLLWNIFLCLTFYLFYFSSLYVVCHSQHSRYIKVNQKIASNCRLHWYWRRWRLNQWLITVFREYRILRTWWVQIYRTYMVSSNLPYVHVEYILILLHGEYKFVLRTRWVQIYLTYMVSTNLSYVHVEYKLILRTWWVHIYSTYMLNTNLSYVHGEFKFI